MYFRSQQMGGSRNQKNQKITFKQKVPQQVVSFVLSKSLGCDDALTNQWQLYIFQFVKLDSQESAQVCQYIDQWNIQQLKFRKWDLHNPKMLQSLNYIKFTFLKRLNLSQLDLQTIQEVAWLDCPSLEYLQLNNNRLKGLKSFMKTNFSQLRGIKLQQNPISQSVSIDCLQRIRTNSQVYQDFDFGTNLNLYGLIQLIKFESKSIINAMSSHQIDRKLKAKLADRFPKIYIRCNVRQRSYFRDFPFNRSYF